MTIVEPIYTLSERLRNPYFIRNPYFRAPEATRLAQESAVETRQSLDAMVGRSRLHKDKNGFFAVIDEGGIADRKFFPWEEEEPKIYTSVEAAAEEALQRSELLKLEDYNKYNNTISVIQICEIREQREKPEIKEGKILPPKRTFSLRDKGTGACVQTEGRFAGIMNRYKSNSDDSEQEIYYFAAIRKDFMTTVQEVIEFEEGFLKNKASMNYGYALVFFGKIVASVEGGNVSRNR